jgi:hypothetical protein
MALIFEYLDPKISPRSHESYVVCILPAINFRDWGRMRNLYSVTKARVNAIRSLWRTASWVKRINLTLIIPLAFLLFLLFCFHSYDFGRNLDSYDFRSKAFSPRMDLRSLLGLFIAIWKFLVDLFWLVVPCTREEWLMSLKHFIPDSLEQWAVLVAVWVWFKSRDDSRKEAIIRAWQVLLDAHDKSGDGGRKLALELLNNSERKKRCKRSAPR